MFILNTFLNVVEKIEMSGNPNISPCPPLVLSFPSSLRNPFLPPSLPSLPFLSSRNPRYQMSVTILSPFEARIGGRKFLYKDSNLFTIRDRESDADYDPDEEWQFALWQGPQVHELPILQQWITHLCGQTQPQPQPPIEIQSEELPQDEQEPRKTQRWVDEYLITFTSTNTTASMMARHEKTNTLWMTEFTKSSLTKKADEDGYVGNWDEFLDTIHWGTAGEAYTPVITAFASSDTLKIEIAYVVCPEFTYVGWFNLKSTVLPGAVLGMLKVQEPAKPLPPLPPSPPSPPPSPPATPTPPPAPTNRFGAFKFRGNSKN